MRIFALKMILAVICLAVVCLAAPACWGQNLLADADLEEGTAGWILNRSRADGAPAELEVVSGEPGQEVRSGQRALLVRNRGGTSHVYRSAGEADVDYEFSFWARGGADTTADDGTVIEPKVGVAVYVYGRPEEHGGRDTYLCSKLQRNVEALGTDWQEFRLPLNVSEADVAGARVFNLVFLVQGEVLLDDAVLQEVETWRDDLLLHLPLDDGFDPAVAGGDPTPEVRGDVRLVEGRRAMAGAFNDGAHLVLDAAGNFDQAEGATAMWIRPGWSEHDGVAHCLFEVSGPGEHAPNPDASFVISKGWTNTNTPNLTYVHISTADWRWGQHISCNFGFEPNEWVHLAATWSASGEFLKLYKNGELVRVEQPDFGPRPPSEGRRMIVGARNTGASPADAVIDDLMVFGRPLTDAEVARVAGRDPATVTPVEDPEPADSSHVGVVEMGPETPHIPLNRPSALDPPKTLFMVAYTHGQEVLELAQRYAMDFSAVVSHSDRQKFGMDHMWFRSYGNRWEELWAEAKLQELSERLDEQPEVLIIANLGFDALPEALQARILGMVGEGMGLVMVLPASVPDGLSQSSEEGRAAILTGVPLAAMEDCFPGEQLSPAELGRRMVRAQTHGAGRVVVIHWYDDPSHHDRGMTPRAASGVIDRRFEHRYNYYLSLVGKAIDWSAGRSPRAHWTGLPQEGQVFQGDDWPAAGLPLELEWTGPDGPHGTVQATLRDAAGRITGRDLQNVQLAAGANDVVVRLPAPPAGLSYLDLAVLTEDRVENWATVSLTLERPERIVSLETTRRHYERDETAEGRVRFAARLPQDAQLVVTATDTYGREYARSSQPLRARMWWAPFSVPLAGTAGQANYIEARVVRNGETLAQEETVVYTPKPVDSEFMSMMWDIVPLPDTMVGHRTYQSIRRAGFNALYRWSYRGDFHNEPMADLMPVHYCTRVTARPNGDGWLQLRSLHLMENYGVDERDHSIANPVMQQVLRDVASVAHASAPLSPWWYSLGDENYVRRGWGYSPYGLEYFRGFLERRYGDIATLNREHGTDYAGFADVPRWREGDEAESVQAIVDHELALDDEWAALHEFLADAIREIDPGARVGTEGSEAADMERTLQGLDVWAPYIGQSELLRSLGPDKLRSHWWGGYGLGASDAAEIWSWLLQGNANFHQYWTATGVCGMLNANLTYRDYFANLLPDLREINGGLGMLLSGASVVSDQDVVIHYSRESFHASYALGDLARTAASDKALVDTLRGMSQDFRYASRRLINDGLLISPRAKLLFLPASYCLSEQEAKGIARFVREGGTLVADTMPGVLNQYGRRLEAGTLDEVFGATCGGTTSPLRIDDLVVGGNLAGWEFSLGLGIAVCDAALQVTTGRALDTAENVPVMVLNEYGQGRALLLNFDLGRAPKAMVEQLVEGLLEVAGVRREYRVEGAKNTKLSVLRRGDVTLVGVMLPAEPPEDARLVWDTPLHAYDVRKQQYLGQVTEATLAPLPPTDYGRRAQAHLIALQAEPLSGIRVRGPSSVARGSALPLTADLNLHTGSAEGRLLRIEVIDPSGRNLIHMRRFLTMTDATPGATFSIPFAFNDPTGRWTVRVTDLATGVRQDRTVRVR